MTTTSPSTSPTTPGWEPPSTWTFWSTLLRLRWAWSWKGWVLTTRRRWTSRAMTSRPFVGTGFWTTRAASCCTGRCWRSGVWLLQRWRRRRMPLKSRQELRRLFGFLQKVGRFVNTHALSRWNCYLHRTTETMCTHSSGAVWKSRWPSWAIRPNEPYGSRGRKATLNHASALVSACPWYVNRHPRILSNTGRTLCRQHLHLRHRHRWCLSFPKCGCTTLTSPILLQLLV